jgi:PncC family amidohydrolase
VTALPGTARDAREPATATTEELVGLARRVAETLGSAHLTVATAESCTGGLIGHVLTEVSGSSTWYVGGAVVYSDELKHRLAGVPVALIASHGAVSDEVARSLATGSRERFGSDLGVAVTGIAGPTGGTPTKPVGLVYVAVADALGVAVGRHVWAGDRSANKRESAAAALRLLLERVAADPGR